MSSAITVELARSIPDDPVGSMDADELFSKIHGSTAVAPKMSAKKIDSLAQTTEHDFTLVLSGLDHLDATVMDALFEAGCDDATPSLRSGTVSLTFARLAPHLKDAILSAIQDVRRAGIGADVARVDHGGLVTLAEIARRIGRSRQLAHQLMTGKRGPGGWPPPVCQVSDSTALWAWCDVADWLRKHDMIREEDLKTARFLDVVNCILEYQHRQRDHQSLTTEISLALGLTP